jgi:hypothetical protein
MLDMEVYEEVRKFIREKVDREMKVGLKEATKGTANGRENRLNFGAKVEESPKLRNWIVKRLPSRK